VCLSGRGLCDGLITRPEESYRLCCVIVCDLETSRTRRLKPASGLWKPVEEEEEEATLLYFDVAEHTAYDPETYLVGRVCVGSCYPSSFLFPLYIHTHG
jgi:hypothetical protein